MGAVALHHVLHREGEKDWEDGEGARCVGRRGGDHVLVVVVVGSGGDEG